MKRPMVAVLLAGVGLWLWLFARVMFCDCNFAFRDAAHFYYPLYQLLQDEWGAGRIPLWNPYDNGGQPMLANPAAAVFYPLKLLFALPIPYRVSYAAYILWHVLQAALATTWVARAWGASRLAAALAGISFAFCGNVLFQYCNVIFLVGAAWLPLAWWYGERMLRRSHWPSALGLGACLALMVLGGDPQMAYIAGLSTAGLAFVLWWQARFEMARKSEPARAASSKRSLPKKRPKSAAAEANPPLYPATSVASAEGSVWKKRLAKMVRHPLALLAIAAVSGGLLCAIQVLPTEEFNRRSTRAMAPVPRNIYELVGYALSNHQLPPGLRLSQASTPKWYTGLLGNPPKEDQHHLTIYKFGVGPWRVIEYFFPNVYGRRFPTHARWLEILRAEDSLWVPSLYMGLIPCVLALLTLRWRRFHVDGGDSSTDSKPVGRSTDAEIEQNSVDRNPALACWLSWLVLIFVLMSWGGYAPGWVARCLAQHELSPPGKLGMPVGDEFGGLYWFCTVVLPGFVQFRFPGKMLVPAALGLSWLCAMQFDRIVSDLKERRRFQLWMRRLASVGLGGAICVLLLAFVWPRLMKNIRADSYWGQFDLWGSYTDLLGAFLQTALLAGCCGWMRWPVTVLHATTKTANSNSAAVISPWPALAMVLLTIVDLGWANGWMISTASARVWDEESRCAALIASADRYWDSQQANVAASPSQPYRVFRIANWQPPVWQTQDHPQHAAEGMRWEHNTLFSQFNWGLRMEMIKAGNTLELIEPSQFFNVAYLPLDDRTVHYVQPRRGLDLWNVKYFLLPIHENFSSLNETTLGLTNAWVEPRWTPEDPQGQPAGPPLPNAVPNPAEFLADMPDVRVLYNPSYLPRAWIVHDMLAIPPLESPAHPVATGVMQALLFPVNKYLDPRQTVVIESEELAARGVVPQPHPPTNVPGEYLNILRYEPLEVVLEGEMKSPGAVVLGDVFYPGWDLKIVLGDAPPEPAKVFRANRGMRCALVPPGRFKLIYRYRPYWFYVGSVLSATAWLALIGVTFKLWLRRRSSSRLSLSWTHPDR